MRKKKTGIDELFLKNQIIKLKLIKESIENPGEKLPTAKQIAEENGVSELTVKKVEKELALGGYLFSNKKGGTRTVRKFAKEQISSFLAAKENFKSIVDSLLRNGFSKEDIMAMVYDVVKGVKDELSFVVYSEKDDGIAVFAKKELERRLGYPVVFKPFETLKTEILNGVISNKLIVVPFYCHSQLEVGKKDVKIIPIKTVHPLEFISQAKDIPYSSRIFYIAASRFDKENALNIYYEVLNHRYRVYIYTQDELLTNRHLLKFADIVIGFRWVMESERALLKDIERVIKVDRFDDEEGIRMIKGYIDEFVGDK